MIGREAHGRRPACGSPPLLALLAFLALLAGGAGGCAARPARPAPTPPAPGVVSVDGGRISGVRDGALTKYLGVPYAAPPTGDLRWRPPQPVPSWQGVRVCSAYGPACPQVAMSGFSQLSPASTAEDCLNLNVWTPARDAGERLPVMVWIHGGSFVTGSGSMPLYDGTKLAQRGVVVVTINYRLGPLGFLALPALARESGGSTGNYGLQDQIAALQWVRRCVAAFGGDPGRVTVFGESAGGMSICELMTSPAATGLFQRAIVESGPFDSARAGMQAVRTTAEAERQGTTYARSLGCTGPDTLARLRSLPVAKLVAASRAGGDRFPDILSWCPVVDGVVLPADPAAVFAAARQAPVPLLVGANHDEARLFLMGTKVTAATVASFAHDTYGADAAAVLRLFPPPRSGGRMARLSAMSTVMGFWAPARFAAAAAKRAGAPSWLYLFSRVPPVSPMGAFHGIELPYVFGNGTLGLDLSKGIDARISDAMQQYWTRFAATGDPNGGGLTVWPAYEPASPRLLEFGDSIRARPVPAARALALADALLARRLAASR